jgi:cob(I)alamin adenosyltransferase
MNQSKGLIIVYTGDGKGKTTAALGLALRTIGWGGKVLIVQFVKEIKTGEHKTIEKNLKQITIKLMGKGFVGILNDRYQKDVHKANAGKALEYAKKEIMSKKWSTVILDEINGAITGGLIAAKDVLLILKSKPDEVTLVLTGRNADSKIIEIADLVTEMKKVKHPFDNGLLAQKGVDY